jgi:predicted nuclease of restriction endonuclease-like RecB superfamily
MITLTQIKKSACAPLNKHLFEIKEVKKSKYKNKRTEIDGIKFDSEKEAKYYGTLKLLLKAGKIGLLERQVPFELNPGGSHSLKYIADFVYVTDTGEKIICDVKGFRTREYLKKKRLMLKVHGIKITEV